MLLTNEINIRDPFVLPFQEIYYLYGTRAATCWGAADGFDCYKSTDLRHWEGPFEVFHRPANFLPDKNYWAPEVHLYQGSFYMFATFNTFAENRKGTMILKADNPLGPFRLHSAGKITPADWNCLDGTFYLSKSGIPYMIFSHEWEDLIDGEICCVRLSDDLTHPVSEPYSLFHASEAKGWVVPISHRRYPGKDIYVTDGPFLYRCKNQDLIMLWSGFGKDGYTEAIARSVSGEIEGPWIQDSLPLFPDNGGHGMVFSSFSHQLYLTLHTPNTHLEEHPVFYPLIEKNGTIQRA